jgi:hypothetical protein
MSLDLGSMFQAQGPAGGKKVKKIPSTVFSMRMVVPILPENCDADIKEAFAVYMALCGTSTSTRVEEWRKYIAVYSSFIVPTVASRLATDVYHTQVISAEVIGRMRTAYTAFKQLMSNVDEPPALGQKHAFLIGMKLDGLPTPDVVLPWEESYSMLHPKMFASHYSIVLFLMSKRVEKDNHAPITQARPEALKKKAHVEAICSFLDGPLRLSDPSHLAINSAWSESASLRAVCVTEFAQYSEMETDIVQDLIYTSMHLMRFGSMSHAKITYAFLRAYPWAGEVPSLKSAVGVFRDSARAALKYSETLRPYLKLIYGDKLTIFPRNELEVLIACAVEVEKVNNPTLQDFYTNDKFGPVVEAFIEELEKRGEIRKKLLDDQLAQGVGGAMAYEEDDDTNVNTPDE